MARRCRGPGRPTLAVLLLAITCPEPTGASVDTTELLNPSEAARSYSTRYGGDLPGTGHARSMLGSQQAWTAGTAAAGEWMQIDLGADRQVVGVAIQGRADYHDQYVTGFTVQHSMNGVDFNSLPTTFTSDATGQATKRVMFSQVTTRYVRIVVQTFSSFDNHISMRAGVLALPGKVEPSPPLRFPLAD